MQAPVDRPEPEWVARLREAGIDVRTGTGVLTREPAASFTLPAGYRYRIRKQVGALLRTAWKATGRRLQRLTHHATVP